MTNIPLKSQAVQIQQAIGSGWTLQNVGTNPLYLDNNPGVSAATGYVVLPGVSLPMESGAVIWACATDALPTTVSTVQGVQSANATIVEVNGPVTVGGSVNATITNASLPVTGTVNANITNATLTVAGSVGITGTPNVAITGTPNVNITNATIPVSGSVTATISGTPNVNITNANIPVTGNVNANITNGSIAVSGNVNATITNASLTVAGNVGITGTPNVNITNASLTVAGNVGITGTPNVNIASGSVNIASGTVNVGNTVNTIGSSTVLVNSTFGPVAASGGSTTVGTFLTSGYGSLAFRIQESTQTGTLNTGVTHISFVWLDAVGGNVVNYDDFYISANGMGYGTVPVRGPYVMMVLVNNATSAFSYFVETTALSSTNPEYFYNQYAQNGAAWTTNISGFAWDPRTNAKFLSLSGTVAANQSGVVYLSTLAGEVEMLANTGAATQVSILGFSNSYIGIGQLSSVATSATMGRFFLPQMPIYLNFQNQTTAYNFNVSLVWRS